MPLMPAEDYFRVRNSAGRRRISATASGVIWPVDCDLPVRDEARNWWFGMFTAARQRTPLEEDAPAWTLPGSFCLLHLQTLGGVFHQLDVVAVGVFDPGLFGVIHADADWGDAHAFGG